MKFVKVSIISSRGNYVVNSVTSVGRLLDFDLSLRCQLVLLSYSSFMTHMGGENDTINGSFCLKVDKKASGKKVVFEVF